MKSFWSRAIGFRNARRTVAIIGLSLGLASTSLIQFAEAQFNGFGRLGVVGGVKIDAEGVVRDATVADRQEVLQAMREHFRGASDGLAKKANLRMVSLKGLQEKIAEAVAKGEQPSEDVLFLGGLTRIEYVFVYPDRQDIVIAGPAENWKLSDQGVVVGQSSGRPVLCLDDLMTAMRSVETARTETISVSIDPTPDGVKRLQQVQQQIPAGSDPRSFDSAMRDAFGPQMVRLTGVPSDSHLANVLLAADYQMKRYGMDLAKAPVKGLPSYIEMVSSRGTSSKLQSRWWLSTDYNAIERSEDGFAWKISGRGIKANTEQEFVDSQGQHQSTGKVDPLAKKWADNFTSKLDELSIKDPVFGELRNIMDLCVVAALVESKDLAVKANCDLSVLRGEKSSIALAKFGSPRTLPPQSSFVRFASGWAISVSGGVMVDSWQVADRTKVNPTVSVAYQEAKPSSDSWCW